MLNHIQILILVHQPVLIAVKDSLCIPTHPLQLQYACVSNIGFAYFYLGKHKIMRSHFLKQLRQSQIRYSTAGRAGRTSLETDANTSFDIS
jgi:hypothetical protein